VLRELATDHGWDIGKLDFYIIHAGGPRILNDLSKFLDVNSNMFRHSWATLTEYGNIASAVVLDALLRLFDEGTALPGAIGMIAGFGPGITAEMAVGSWIADTPPNMGANSPPYRHPTQSDNFRRSTRKRIA
jgi:1,3,6,8-tetrahydroxynaphthalene synthase